MRGLPVLSGKDVIRMLERVGYRVVRQSGSHIRLNHISKKSVTVPNHKSIGRGLLRKILRDAEILREEFMKLVSAK